MSDYFSEFLSADEDDKQRAYIREFIRVTCPGIAAKDEGDSPADLPFIDVQARVIPDPFFLPTQHTEEAMQTNFTQADSAIAGLEAVQSIMTSLGIAQRTCEAHGAYEAKGTRLRTRDVWTTCPACRTEAEQKAQEAAKTVQQAAEVSKLEGLLLQAAVPARFHGKTFANFERETQPGAFVTIEQYAQNFESHYRRGAGLVLAGPPGTGKSHLAAALLQFIMPAHCGHYATALEIIRAVRNTWRKDSEQSETEILHHLSATPLLVLDEIGASYGTDGEATILFDLMDKRYRNMKPTILLTNQDGAGLRTFLGERTFDRLLETSQWVAFGGASYRKTAGKAAA